MRNASDNRIIMNRNSADEKKKRLILTALGKDRPGIVAEVSKVLFEAGCNIEDSSMTILEGEFAMILVISLTDRLDLAELDRKFEDVRTGLGLAVFLKSMTADEMHRPVSENAPFMISVYGTDRPGIVYRVANLLAGQNVNITDVNTRRMTEGESYLYVMMLEVEYPKAADPQALEAALNSLAGELNITITVHPIETITP